MNKNRCKSKIIKLINEKNTATGIAHVDNVDQIG